MPPVEEARSLFRRLGYAVDGEGTALRAERKWRTVRVTVLGADEASEAPFLRTDGGADDGLRCFVTWMDDAETLRDRVAARDAPGEWAVVGVDGDGDHEVVARADA
jgi:hypothetical protein